MTDLPILTISQLTQAIKLQLETTFPSIWVQGEVSNCKQQSSGHLYFSLKDSKAQISAVMFRADMIGLKSVPKDGDHIIVQGELNVYPPSGKYQIVARQIRPVGLGELLLKLEELKAKLQQKGWFSAIHKKPLPKCPKRIGVVTSPTGAVIQDILNVLSRRLGGFHLILNPVKVQGEGAAQEIALAIEQFNKYELVDVLIVGRGGGSLEDLWAFNEEIVAEAIFNSTIPIVSAVGHETDHSIADLVADVRAPTPSAAAEIVSADKIQYKTYSESLSRRFQQTVEHRISQRKQQLKLIIKQPILASPYSLLSGWYQKNDALRQDLDLSVKRLLSEHKNILSNKQKQAQALRPSNKILLLRQQLSHWESSILYVIDQRISKSKHSLEHQINSIGKSCQHKIANCHQMLQLSLKRKQLKYGLERVFSYKKDRLSLIVKNLRSIDPTALLKKGYCILFAEKDGSVIKSIESVKIGQEVKTLLADGKILSTINNVESK